MIRQVHITRDENNLYSEFPTYFPDQIICRMLRTA